MNEFRKKKKQVEGCCCLLYSIKGKGEMGLEVSSFHFVCSSLIIIDNCSSSSFGAQSKIITYISQT